MTNLLERVEHSIRERELFRRGERVLAAVSGGLDSMVLLHLLHALAARNCWELLVAHFNHQLRGRSSDADEQFVRQSCGRLGRRCFTERANCGQIVLECGGKRSATPLWKSEPSSKSGVAAALCRRTPKSPPCEEARASRGTVCGAVRALAKLRGVSIEMAARDLRHGFLAKTAQQLQCPTVALAHHADDQVELLFLRLLRGAGGEGLAGMKWRSPSPANPKVQLVRPLLDVSRTELEQFAGENKIRFREDASNASREILRNRIRHDLLPLIRRRFQPALDKNLLRAMEIVGAESEVVESMARAWLAKKRPAFARLAVAVQRRVVQLQLRQLKVAEDFDLIDSLRRAPARPFTIRPNVSVERDSAGRVFVRTATQESFKPNRLALELRGGAGEAILDGLCICWRVIARTGARFQRAQGCEQFDADKVGRHIVLRHWRPGDRFQPIGMASAVKLQDWFTNRKVPRPERRRLVVAATAAGEVFWIENQRMGEGFKLGPATQRRLIWTWQRE